jgi:phi13 family phage major tail protein
MPPNQNEYKSTVGVDSLYIAEILADSAAAYTADTPEWLAPLASLSQEPATNSETQYADNQAYDSMFSVGETTITATITNLPAEMYAKITGQVFDATTGRVYENEGAPPEFALGFRSLKSNGKYRYYWFAKVKFGIPKEEAATKTDTPEFKTRELTITALKTIHKFDLGDGKTDSIKRVWGDEDTDSFSATGWFTQVQVPGVAAVDPLALSASDPADGAPAVAVDKTITLTFNNKLPAGEINDVVVTKDDGTVVACTNSLDATGKILTINPDANLGAASDYIVTYAVIDIYDQVLSGAINFTTA